MAFYRTTDDVNLYFLTQLFADDWLGASFEDQQKALIMATQMVDRLDYEGEKLEEDQELKFPRLDEDNPATPQSWILALSDATSGTYKLIFNFEVTTDLQWDDDAATIQAALEALPSVEPGDLTVTGVHPIFTVAMTTSLVGNVLETDPGDLFPAALVPRAATSVVLNDNIPDNFFYGVCEEARSILSGRDAEQEYRNLILTSDGVGSNRVSNNRSTMGPKHTIHLITSPRAWQYLVPFLDDEQGSFNITRTN